MVDSFTKNHCNSYLTHAKLDKIFSKTPLVLAGRAAERLVLRPKEDMPRLRLEPLRPLEGGLNRAEEYLMFPRQVVKEGLKELREPVALAIERGRFSYCPDRVRDCGWGRK